MPNSQVAIDSLPKDDHFWMCWVEGKRKPRFRHACLAKAAIEADRLCTETRRRVFITEAIGCVLPDPNAPKPAEEAK